jgi:hypothetical protein
MAQHSYGVSVELFFGGGSFEVLSELVSVDVPDLDVTVAPSHHLTSTNAIKTTIPGMIDGGEVRCTLRFTKNDYEILTGILTDRDSEVQVNFYDLFPSEVWATLNCFIKTLGGPQVQEDDTINQEVVIKSNSKIVDV